MREHPILFNAPMVRAYFAGRKTQTRRIATLTDACHVKEPNGHRRWHPDDPEAILACPWGGAGDLLWGRETWAAPHCCDHLKPREIEPGTRVHYGASEPLGGLLGRPSIFMPRWASRITPSVTHVRLERLRDVTEVDAIAEGIERVDDFFDCVCWKVYGEPAGADVCAPDDPIGSFRSLWDSLNAKRGAGWDVNPWVWVLEFPKFAGAK